MLRVPMSTPPAPAESKDSNAPYSPGYSRYVLGILFCLTALNVMDRQVLATLNEPIKAAFGASDTAMGLLLGTSFTIFHVVSAIPIARWADHGNRRSIIAGGLFAWSALTAVTGAAQNFAHVFATRMGVGIGETVGSGPTQSLVADYFPPEKRAAAFSILGSGGVVGSMLGFALGGWLAQHFGWRLTFVFFGVPGVALAALLFFTVREPVRGAMDGIAVSDERDSVGRVVGFLFSLPSFRHVVAAGALNAFANYAMLSWAQAFLMRTHGLSIQDAGFTLALAMSASTTLGLWTSGFVGDRLGARDPRWYAWLPAGASVATVPLLVTFLLAPTLGTAIAFLVPAAFFNTMWLGTGNAILQGLAKPRMRATAASLNVLFNSGIGYGLGPLTVGVLSDWFEPSYGVDSLRYALFVAVLPQLWAAAHSYLASRTLRGDLRAKERR